jgi:phosphopantetheinyl transferase (holo-ACP synthase)
VVRARCGHAKGIADQFAILDAAFKAVGGLHAEALTFAGILLDFLY